MSSAPKKVESAALILYLLGLLVALWAAGGRIQSEKRHETTEIVLDAAALLAWQDVMAEQGAELPQKLLDSKVSSLAFGEVHLEELEDRGKVVVQTSPQFQLTMSSGALASLPPEQMEASLQKSGGTFLIFVEPKLAEGLLPQLKLIFGSQVTSFADHKVVWLPQAKKVLRTAGLGFDPLLIERYQNMGFSVWLRPENRPGLTPTSVKELYAAWSQLPGVQGVVFGGAPNEALGYPELLDESAAELKSLGWKVGYIEMPPRAQQKGIETTVRKLPHQTVRVMAVAPLHQAKLSPFRVLGMYSLGSRERNIRVLYVRPFAVAGRPSLDEEFLFSLAGELEGQGQASLFQEGENLPPSLPILILYAVAGGSLALLLWTRIGLPYHPALWALPAIAVVGAVGAVVIGKGTLYRSLLALAIGIAAPTCGFLQWVFPMLEAPSEKAGVTDGLKALILVSLSSLSAGIFLAALLTDTTFLLGLDRFRGVKLLTLGAPVLIIGCFLLRRYPLDSIMEGLKSPVAVYQACLAGVVAVVLGFLLLRTGNASGGAASESERTLRVVLDRLLGVRPRFKEFMLAHPAMLCAPFFARKTGFLPTLVLILMAGIGQAGIVDTFAHVHTPLDVTLIRVGLGVGFGAIVGMIALAAYQVVGRPIENALRARMNS